ncbi:MAG: NAD-dependent epimerase/dehydratase family protein [Syntrophales bacterium]
MIVLVTGARGFIGKNLVVTLRQLDGIDVIEYDTGSLTREELARAEDRDDYYRITPDDRDLNYNKYFTEGAEQISLMEDYNSHNTRRLTIDGIKEKLLKLDYIQQQLHGE